MVTATTKAAPGELELVRSFVNTLDRESGEDELADPASLVQWLSAHGLLAGGMAASPRDLSRARRLREALRALLAENNGCAPAVGAREVLEEIARRGRLALRFDPRGGARIEPQAHAVAGALGQLVAIVADAMRAGTWTRLKACRDERCGWAFYDRTKNRSGTWCSMAVCGNRAKVRAYRARSRA